MYAGVRALLKFEVKAKSVGKHYRIEYISSPGRYLAVILHQNALAEWQLRLA